MSDIVIYTAEQLSSISQPIAAEQLQFDHPQQHIQIIDNGQSIACCSIWWQNTPIYQHYQTGLIGHFQANNEAAADVLLEVAIDQLKLQGTEYVIGPMNGSTWKSYRLVCESDNHTPPFFMEPQNPPQWTLYFINNDFDEIAHYHSTRYILDKTLAAPVLTQEMQRQGIYLDFIPPDALAEQLEDIYQLSLQAFADNFLYSDIHLSEFKALYLPLGSYLDSQWMPMLRKDNELLAYAFCIPQPHANTTAPMIFKTLAVHPAYQGQGLGRWLTNYIHHHAARTGYQEIIHALMHTENTSRKMSRGSELFRRYCLYGREI